MRPPFLLVLALLFAMGAPDARGRDLDGLYANSPLHEWFENLKSAKGPCCSNADGSVVIDADWESKDGHYRVRIKDAWVDVPDEAVVKVPNMYGPTMVWPVYIWNANGGLRVEIRCFMPGSMG